MRAPFVRPGVRPIPAASLRPRSGQHRGLAMAIWIKDLTGSNDAAGLTFAHSPEGNWSPGRPG
jgi:hypothetical protein